MKRGNHSQNINNDSGKNSQAVDGKQKRKKTESIDSSIIDEKTKVDIIAVVVIVLSIAIFTVLLIPTNALITSIIVNAIKLIFGIGAYIFPIILIFLGISYFFKNKRQYITARLAIGLSLIFVAVLTISTLCSNPVSINKPELLFDADLLTSYGGIIGSSIAWLGVTLLGKVVTLIIMTGLIITGLIIIGFSISKVINRLKLRKEEIESLNNSTNFYNMPNYDEKTKDIFNDALFNNQGQVLIDVNGKILTSKIQNPENFVCNAVDPSLINEDGTYHQNTKKPTFRNRKNFGKRTRIIPKSKENKISNSTDNSKKTLLLNNKTNDNFNKTNNAKKSKKSKKTNFLSANSMGSTQNISMPKPQDGFILPSFDFLKQTDNSTKNKQSNTELKETAKNLQTTLYDFGISANVVGWIAGPTVTLFKIDLPAGVRVSKITNLNDDIALALAAPGVRVFAPIPGTTYVGIEVPNVNRETVLLSDVIKNAKPGPLQMAIGKDVEGNCIITDLSKMPHLLIGGTTGSGKSVSINAMIMSILMRATPSEVRLILVDPKRVEFTPYNGIPHLYVPVVTEAKEAASALSWGVAEMERRLKIFSSLGVRNIGAYNAKVQKITDEEKKEQDLDQLPYIVIIIDELADLMMAVGKEVEFSISRIAQLARAAGIHLIVATQRPSTNVVTGLIKANITNRIAFNVASGIDSRVILDTGGAESLIGLGDMLFNKPEFSKPVRLQGCYISEEEINLVVNHLKEQGKPEYHNDILQTNLINVSDGSSSSSSNGSSTNSDEDLFWQAAEMVVNAKQGSTSSLQRRFKIGYARAGRIMDQLEEMGIVGPQNGSKPREVLVDILELEGMKALDDYDNNK